MSIHTVHSLVVADFLRWCTIRRRSIKVAAEMATKSADVGSGTAVIETVPVLPKKVGLSVAELLSNNWNWVWAVFCNDMRYDAF